MKRVESIIVDVNTITNKWEFELTRWRFKIDSEYKIGRPKRNNISVHEYALHNRYERNKDGCYLAHV